MWYSYFVTVPNLRVRIEKRQGNAALEPHLERRRDAAALGELPKPPQNLSASEDRR